MSLQEKTKKWLAKKCPVSLKGKTVVITGANSGVGFKTAETMAYLGAKVILACRNMDKARVAKEKLVQEYPDAVVDIMLVDLSSLASIDNFVDEVQKNNVDIHAFLNNAGIFRQPGKTTKDGFELVIGTNYIGVYYLTERLLPYIKGLPHSVVYVNTISMIHKIAKVEYEDFYYTKHYNDFAVYARSKLCLAKYTYALAQQNKQSNLLIYMNHPGITITPLGLKAYGEKLAKTAKRITPLFNSTETSSLSLVYLLSHDLPVGSIVGPTKGLGGWGYPKKNHIYKRVKTEAEELIHFTEEEIQRKRQA